MHPHENKPMSIPLYRFYVEFTARGGDGDSIAVWAENAEAAATHERLMYQPTSRISPGFSVDPIPDAVRVGGGDTRILSIAEREKWARMIETRGGIDRAGRT